MSKENAEIIQEISLFAVLPADQVRYLSENMEIAEYPADSILFQEGDRSDRFSIILEGEVEVIKSIGMQDERLLAVAGEGDFLGEMSLLHPDRRRTASVIARTDVRLLEMNAIVFNTILERVPALSYAMLRELVTRYHRSESLTIRLLLEKNLNLTRAYQELQAAQAQLIEKEKLEYELQMARNIQESTLPDELPDLDGWQLSAYWKPARSVSGDFYEFITFADGRLGIIAGDVTGKGVPAALVMASSLSVLRAASLQSGSPAEILELANNVLVKEMPPNMFVTCLYLVLEPPTGSLWVANAGHNYPVLTTSNGVSEIRARGMPLGLMLDMSYEQQTSRMSVGDGLLLYSDGLVEAHNLDGEMYGVERLKDMMSEDARDDATSGETVIDRLVGDLTRFTGSGQEQEDDTTLVYLAREAPA